MLQEEVLCAMVDAAGGAVVGVTVFVDRVMTSYPGIE